MLGKIAIDKHVAGEFSQIFHELFKKYINIGTW